MSGIVAAAINRLNVSLFQQNEKAKEASDHIRRLSILHDLVSIDSPEGQIGDEAEQESPRTPAKIRELRRRHASKSVYIEQGDDPIKPGDLKRSRPLSLPPGADLDDPGMKASMFDGEHDNERISNDLRKYGLTRTRSFNRKHRNGVGVLSGSSGSVADTNDAEKRSPTNAPDDSDKFDMLEKRLSIISDDENTSIKNTLRKVSQAFSSYGSEHTLDTQRAQSNSTATLTADIDAFLAQDELWKSSTLPRTKRRSLGSIISETINPPVSHSLDSTKKRAFSTSVINEVSVEMKDEELEQRQGELESDLDEDTEFTDRVARFKTKQWDRAAPSGKSGQPVHGPVSELSLDRQMSTEGIQFTVGHRFSIMENEDQPVDSKLRGKQRSSAQNKTNHAELQNYASTENDSDFARVDKNGNVAPMRPAAPSTLNYVRSYTASIRRYRKKNVEIGESKSVYDRIREYTALVSKEKNEQKGKTVDEMLESLDSANVNVSAKYIDSRRKFTRMASIVGEQKQKDSVLSAPHIWFDTKPPKEELNRNGTNDVSQKIAGKDASRSKVSIGFNASKEKPETTDSRSFGGITAILNSWRSKESNTLPRNKPTKVQATNGKTGIKASDTAKDTWSKAKSHTIAEGAVDNFNHNITISIMDEMPLEGRSGTARTSETEECEEHIPVKDLVKKYYQQVIIPGEKEVEDMIESNMRRSKKKKEREKMKSSLQRKLSLRNLAVEEDEKEKNKLNRSLSCENVQRGTVKQLISLFNVTKQ